MIVKKKQTKKKTRKDGKKKGKKLKITVLYFQLIPLDT